MEKEIFFRAQMGKKCSVIILKPSCVKPSPTVYGAKLPKCEKVRSHAWSVTTSKTSVWKYTGFVHLYEIFQALFFGCDANESNDLKSLEPEGHRCWLRTDPQFISQDKWFIFFLTCVLNLELNQRSHRINHSPFILLLTPPSHSSWTSNYILMLGGAQRTV